MDRNIRSTVLMSSAAGSLLGARSWNNDRAYSDASTAVVIDAVGDDERGFRTSATALAGALAAVSGQEPDDTQRAVRIVERAAAALRDLGEEAAQATITVVAVSGGDRLRGHLAWLGDSPAFLLRGGVLQQLTRPHNQAQELAERLHLDLTVVRESPLADNLTRGLVGDEGPVETLTVGLESGDRVLVASDGVLAVPPVVLGRALSRGDDARSAVGEILDAAIVRGAADNTSVAVITVAAPPAVATGSVSVLRVEQMAGLYDTVPLPDL